MDTLGALALGTEPPTPELLTRPPVGKNHPLISAVMWRNIVGQAIYQLAVLFAILYGGSVGGYELESRQHYTFLFNCFVFCQIFNEINCRKVNKEGKKKVRN
jgi:Ca2+-transporting ATPase